jgi:hypothetical protein
MANRGCLWKPLTSRRSETATVDSHSGEDLAGEIRQYFLLDDFSNWKDHDSFERAFAALPRDLRAQAGP